MVKSRAIHIVMILMVICLVVMVVACTTPTTTPSTPSTTTTPTTATKTLKLGITVPLTGAGANWGREMQRCYELLIDDVNGKGGLQVGNEKYLLEVIAVDNKFVATEAVAGANKLIFQDGVKYISNIGSAASLAILPITEANKVITTHASYAAVLGKDKPYSFRPQYTGIETAEGLYGYIATNTAAKTVVFMCPDDDSGKANAQMGVPIAESKGLKVLSTNYLPRGTTDFYPTLTKVLPTNPDIIDTDNMPPADTALLVKQARERGFKGNMLTLASLDLESMISVAGDAAEGFMSPDQDLTGDIATPEQKAYVERYLKKYGPPFSALAGNYYNFPATVAASIQAAGTIDTEKVAAIMPDMTWKVLGIDLKWGGTQRYGIKHQIIQPIYTSAVKNGKLVTIGYFTPDVP